MKKQPAIKVTAKTLLDLLKTRHSKDVFVPECKNGPTQGAVNMVRLDAWAMKKSWSCPHTYGYEIKVTRNDFLRDDKWHLYLPYCTHFYFVVIPGIVDITEVPTEAGLLVSSKNGTRLYEKKKAPRRDITIDEDVLRYVLICRARIEREYEFGDETTVEYWRGWLAQKNENREMGSEVARALRVKYSEDVRKVERRIKVLESEVKTYSGLEAFLKDEGLSLQSYSLEEDVAELLVNGKPKIPEIVGRCAQQVETAVEKLLNAIESV